MTISNRTDFRLILVTLLAWLMLYAIDSEDPHRLHLQMTIRSEGACLVHSAYVVVGQEKMVVDEGRYVPSGGKPVQIAIPVPHTRVQTVWVRVLSDSAFIDVLDVSFHQGGSLFWPSRLLHVLPLETVQANWTHPASVPIDAGGLRFPLNEEDLTLLKLRTTDRLDAAAIAPVIPFLQCTATSLVLGVVFLAGWRQRRWWSRFVQSPACPAVILVGVACVLLATVRLFPPPTEAADELGYMQAAYGISGTPCPPGYQRVYWELPNLLYTGLGRLAFALSPQAEGVMQRFQIALYVLSCGLLWFLARRLTTPGWASATVGFAALCAFHSHSRYFMPETVYGALFTGVAVWWCLGVARRPVIGVLGAGFLCAALYYVKPHGLAVIAAVGGCCLLVPWVVAPPGTSGVSKVKRSLAGGGLFAVSTLACLALLSFALAPFKQDSDAIRNLADYTGMIKLLTHGEPLSWGLVGRYGQLATAQLLLVTPYLAAPIYLAGRLWFQVGPTRSAPHPEVRLLVLFAVMTFLATYAMTIHFTLRIGEDVLPSPSTGHGLYFRAYGRYYSFVLPLFFVLFAVWLGRPQVLPAGRRSLVFAVAAAVALGVSLVVWAIPRASIRWYDFPESYGLNTQLGLALAVICLLAQAVAVGTSGRRGPVQAAVCALLVYAGYNAGQVARDSHQWSLRQRHQVTAGRMFAEKVPEAERPSTVLVSSFAATEHYFVFPFRYSPLLPIENSSSIPEIATLSSDARWLVTHEAANPQAAADPRLTLVSRYMGYKLYAIAGQGPLPDPHLDHE